MTFKGGTGKISYWDGEKNVEMDSVNFVLLDIRSSVTGWSDAKNTSIYSNVVKSTKYEEIVVKCGKEEIARGIYSEIKGDIVAAGGKFQLLLYTLAEIDGSYVPACLKFSGSALAGWSHFMEDKKLGDVYNSVVSLTRSDKQLKKGSVKYYAPEFSMSTLPAELDDKAGEFDKNHLQPYLNGEPEKILDETLVPEDEESDVSVPF